MARQYMAPTEREREAALRRSHRGAEALEADPKLRRRLEEALRRLDKQRPFDPADLSPSQAADYQARLEAAAAATKTADDPCLLARLRGVIEDLDARPPVQADPEELRRIARAS